jgi:signal transduction histidine kinase
LWVSLSLGALTALIGALAVQHLTRRLKRLTLSVGSIGRADAAHLSVPSGQDEVTQLGAAFARLLADLEQERAELKTLSNELERRVAVRTKEVERLAEESRYAAVVRERLKMARDLHDTLAHSIMALLSEIRLMRRLQIHDPQSLKSELARAEELAHEGLKEARTAIAQIRVNAVRETGLGAALSNAFETFLNHTGLSGEFRADPEAARFGDDRAETLLRMTQEALRNVERHALATRVDITLQVSSGGQLDLCIADNGVGFDVKTVGADHFGLVGLREQAELIGAELLIVSEANRGTRVIVQLRVSPIDFGTQSRGVPGAA